MTLLLSELEEEIKRLEEGRASDARLYHMSLDNMAKSLMKQRTALKKLGEKVRSKHRAWREEQHWHDIDLGRVKRLEDALVEERARRIEITGEDREAA